MFEEELFSIEKYVKDKNKILAHISDIKNPETLLEHSDLVIKYFKKIYEDKNLEIIFDKFSDKFFGENKIIKKFWNEMIVNTIYMHDIGKLNINFQIDKMKNKIFEYLVQEGGERETCIVKDVEQNLKIMPDSAQTAVRL